MKQSGFGNIALVAPFVCLVMLWLSVPVLLLCAVFAMPIALIASMRVTGSTFGSDDYIEIPDFVPDHFND